MAYAFVRFIFYLLQRVRQQMHLKASRSSNSNCYFTRF